MASLIHLGVGLLMGVTSLALGAIFFFDKGLLAVGNVSVMWWVGLTLDRNSNV